MSRKTVYLRLMRRLNCLAIFTISITMSGCADWSGVTSHVAKIDAPGLNPGDAIRAAGPTAVASANAQAQWPQVQWWTVFGDPQLNRLVETGIHDSPTQAVAAARLRQAMSLAGEARAGTLPSLDADVSLTRQHWPESGYYNGGFGGENTFDNVGMLNFSYSLDLFGAKKNAAEQAVDGAHAAAAESRAAQLSLESNIVGTYVQMSLQYRVQDVQQRTLADEQRVLDFAQRRFKAGIATQLEISEAEAPLPQSRLLLEQTSNAIALSRDQLAALIGQGPGAGDALARPSLQFDTDVALPSALPAELIGHRPDVVALRWRVEAQARSIDVAKAAFYPNIDLAASGGGSAVGAIFSTFTRLSSMGFTAGPAISLPIFEGGRLRAGLGVATANYDIAVGQYNDTVLRALREIADQVVTFRSLQRQQQEALESQATAQRSFDIAMTGFKRGLTGYLNVLTAEDRLLQEQQSVAHVQAARFSAYANLMTALGGGLAQPSDAPRDTPADRAVDRAAAKSEASAQMQMQMQQTKRQSADPVSAPVADPTIRTAPLTSGSDKGRSAS